MPAGRMTTGLQGHPLRTYYLFYIGDYRPGVPQIFIPDVGMKWFPFIEKIEVPALRNGNAPE
jgi:hypothetical protein